MKHVYRINFFHNDRGEAFTAIFCESLNELAIETSGEIACTEQSAIEDVLSGTPWAGAEDLTFAESWPEMSDDQYESMCSESLRDWINAKE